jgi:hypothetical protein
MALPSTSRCLGATDLRPSRGRHASSGSARLFVAMQGIRVSLHSIRSRSMLFRLLHRRSTTNIAPTATTSSAISSFDTPFKTLLGILGYWALLFKASSRLACLQGLLEVFPARLLAAMLGDLGVSTLRLIKTMTQFSSLFWSIKPAMLSASMLGDYSTSASSTPLVFLVVST